MPPGRAARRLVNVITLGTTQPLAIDQLKASIKCTPAYLRLLLAENYVRDVLNLNERIFRRCAHAHSFRALYREFGIDPFEAVLVDPRLGRFSTTRYPQMVRALEHRRT